MNAAKDWNIVSEEKEGFYTIVAPESSVCSVIRFYRLNLNAGSTYNLVLDEFEMNAVLVQGSARLNSDLLPQSIEKLDSFYLPPQYETRIEAVTDCIFYIPAAPYDGIGSVFFRKYQDDLPPGDIYQVHGDAASRRDVFFTLNPEVPASRLICGFAFGGVGSWTSWPPHQHSNDLEELYCYFDMPEPKIGIQFSYTEPGGLLNGVHQVVKSGHIVLIPEGYHPTVAIPGCRNTYLWAMASHSHESRRYDLSIPDPYFLSGKEGEK